MDEELIWELEKEFTDIILYSESASDILKIWEYGKSNGIFSDFKICKFSDNIGFQLPDWIRSSKHQDFSICSLTNKKKIFYLDDAIYDEMHRTGKADYNVRTCVCLDTQAVSYLKKPLAYFKEGKMSNNTDIDTDTLCNMSFVSFLLSRDIEYTTELYLLENSQKIDEIKMEELYMNLCAVERFLAIDQNSYRKSGEVKFDISDAEVFIKADHAFDFIRGEAQKPEVKKYFELQKFIYVLLLKMCEIEFKHGKKSAQNKILMLSTFVNDELGCFAERELVICYLYWRDDERLKPFFRRIKDSNPNIIKDIKGMAWDLFHIRHMERNILNGESMGAKIELDSIITFDVGLQNVIKVSSLKGMIIKEGIIYPIYEESFKELLKEIKKVAEIFPRGRDIRMEVRGKCDLHSLICSLEFSVKELSKCF